MIERDAGFTVIAPVSLKDLVLKAIRDAILSGKLSPGSRLVESRVSKQMQVAQNVVREALHELEFQGFVVRQANKGTLVTDLSLDDVRQVYRLRVELEGFAVKLGRESGRPNEEDVRQLKQALEEMDGGVRRADFYEFSRADLKFHEIIWAMSGNKFVEKALRTVATPQFAYVLIRSFHHTRLNLPAIVLQHQNILDELTTRDAETCRNFVRQTTEDFGRQIEDCVLSSDRGSPSGLEPRDNFDTGVGAHRSRRTRRLKL